MNLIDKKFARLKLANRAALVPFLVAGDPDITQSLELLKTAAQNSDILEVGFPFSDPLADGPIIQKAHARALNSGTTPSKVFNLVKKVKTSSDIPLVAMVYANLILQRGINKFYSDCRKSGIDGIIIPDVPLEEITPYLKAAKKYDIKQILMVAPTTTSRRLYKILKTADGFIYLVSSLGVTGIRKQLPGQLPNVLATIKQKTQTPVAVGFGINSPIQAKRLSTAGADGIIIGSAIIELLQKKPKNQQKGALKKYLSSFAYYLNSPNP